MELEFHAPEIAEKDRYGSFYSATPQRSSDFSVVNIYAWSEYGKYEWAFTEHICWLRLNYPDHQYWAPVGDWTRVNWKKELRNLFPGGITFRRVPDRLAIILRDSLGEDLEIIEDRNEWEYVYSVPHLIALRGNSYHGKKNLLNQFITSYSHEYEEISEKNLEEILLMQKEWCSWKRCDGSKGLKTEHDAIIRTLGNWKEFDNIMGGLIRVDGKIVAYTIGEKIDPSMLVIHYEKGITDFRGIYQAMNQFFLSRSAVDFKWVNREQDVGSPGLRRAKLSYHPDHFVKKYILTWKPSGWEHGGPVTGM
ncbi:MAG: DUF2156 domain-containing protein [Synergistales bacterium]|nr:DUF2156 domain-containing protein [Synergistales bacterium]